MTRLNTVNRFAPNDPLFLSQWHLNNSAQPGKVAGTDLNVTAAWGLVSGNGVVIGIVDSGVYVQHPVVSLSGGWRE